jgi:hypothetical protein
VFSFVETRDSVASQDHARRQLLPAAAWQWHSAARAARAAGGSSIRQRQTPPGLRCAVSAFCPRIRSLGGGVHAAHVWAPASRAQRTAQHSTAACVPPAQRKYTSRLPLTCRCAPVYISRLLVVSLVHLSLLPRAYLCAQKYMQMCFSVFFLGVCRRPTRVQCPAHLVNAGETTNCSTFNWMEVGSTY